MPIKAEDIARLTYEEAVSALIVNPETSYMLRQRMREDGGRDVVEALGEAELLVALLKLRSRCEAKRARWDGRPAGRPLEPAIAAASQADAVPRSAAPRRRGAKG